jgi:hypothetical protein
MTVRGRLKVIAAAILVTGVRGSAPAAEIVRLTAGNFELYAPAGKEAEAIHGDYVLRNDRIVAIVADPAPHRTLNHRVKDIGGAVIGLTGRAIPDDHLTAFVPGGRRSPDEWRIHRNVAFSSAVIGEEAGRIVLSCTAPGAEDQPLVLLRYVLADGWDGLLVETEWINQTNRPLEIAPVDEFAPEKHLEYGSDEYGRLVWVADRWWGQAWGILSASAPVRRRARNPDHPYLEQPFRYVYGENAEAVHVLAPGERWILSRWLIAAPHALGIRTAAGRLAGGNERLLHVLARDPDGPVADAELTVWRDGNVYGWARADVKGQMGFSLPPGTYELRFSGPGRPPRSLPLKVRGGEGDASGPLDVVLEMDAPGYIMANITDTLGRPTPCKVQFYGRGETPDPFFFPDHGEHLVHNCYYSHDGRFRLPIMPGSYEVIVSRGPEYDAVYTQMDVKVGTPAPLEASLHRTVDTAGWVSADFHNHSSPSGDNNASPLGRVLNLLCEHIEFAPATEHNRLYDYRPYIERLGVGDRIATAVGVELSGQPFGLNHHNAFPLTLRPGAPEGGAPATDADPVAQIERLAGWDSDTQKLVQQNHPDGHSLERLPAMFQHMDVMEVYKPHFIFEPADRRIVTAGIDKGANPVSAWLRLMNRGHRIPAVFNSDAHFNFHGSGWVRNYIRSPTDEPGRIDTRDIIRAASAGNIVISSGPFLEVTVTSADGAVAIPGDDLRAAEGQVDLGIRIQCANWMDVDRVQVFLNGRPDPALNFTRRHHAEMFGEGVVKFHRTIRLSLAQDTHIIVATVQEGGRLAPVIVPTEQGDLPPAAMSNPIFVDVDGGGFRAGEGR